TTRQRTRTCASPRETARAFPCSRFRTRCRSRRRAGAPHDVCLALIALQAHPRLPLVIAANRDEFHERAAEPAHWWASGVLAGVDRVAGGTWFGVDATGRWALVTNYREGVARDPDAPSRGELVTRALAGSTSPLVCAAAIVADGDRYHGFNLLLGQVEDAAYG